jgi:hypothetical protein
MKLRMRHTAPAVIVAVALGAGSALLATSAGGGATDAKPSLATVATAENGESPERAGLARGVLVPEAWGALIDYESLAAVAR